MSDHQLETRVAVAESKIEDLEHESQRTRGRLHDLESDRAAIRLLSGQVREIIQSTEAVATRAAEKAIGFALAQRDKEDAHRRSSKWSRWMGAATAGAALGAFIVAIVALVLK